MDFIDNKSNGRTRKVVHPVFSRSDRASSYEIGQDATNKTIALAEAMISNPFIGANLPFIGDRVEMLGKPDQMINSFCGEIVILCSGSPTNQND